MFGLESEASVQRRYNLSKTTLQQSRLWGMVHNTVFLITNNTKKRNTSPENIKKLIHLFIFYSTTKHEILQISNHNLLCSLDPPNQGWLF